MYHDTKDSKQERKKIWIFKWLSSKESACNAGDTWCGEGGGLKLRRGGGGFFCRRAEVEAQIDEWTRCVPSFTHKNHTRGTCQEALQFSCWQFGLILVPLIRWPQRFLASYLDITTSGERKGPLFLCLLRTEILFPELSEPISLQPHGTCTG